MDKIINHRHLSRNFLYNLNRACQWECIQCNHPTSSLSMNLRSVGALKLREFNWKGRLQLALLIHHDSTNFWYYGSNLPSAECEIGFFTGFLLGHDVANVSQLFIMMISFVELEGKKSITYIDVSSLTFPSEHTRPEPIYFKSAI